MSASESPLDAKLRLLEGRDFWHTQPLPATPTHPALPPLNMTDGPHGLREQLGQQQGYDFVHLRPSVCFPPAVTLAATWNPELLQEVGAALGRQARARGIGLLLGPGMNIKRSPLCGRNFEYFSEDPLLSGTLAGALVRGVQGQGVGACLKHFAANNQEWRRVSSDSRVDERTLRELYLRGFERAVRQARPWAVMSAYNKLNGQYCGENPELLDILRQEWGFDGAVISDWGAVSDRVAGVRAGQDLEMPGFDGARVPELREALAQGRLSEGEVDACLARLRTLMTRAAEGAATPFTPLPDAEAYLLARRVAAEGCVLLKNEDDLLPLPPGASLAVIGTLAAAPRYQGAGSSRIHPTQLDVPLEELRRAFPGLHYAAGYDLTDPAQDPALLQEAVQAAQKADIAVVFVGLPETGEMEGVDRQHLDLPAAHNALVAAVAAVNPRTVVVLQNGSPVTLPWLPRVPAVLEAYLGGQAGGGALADVLTGTVNPSGKLAETFPASLASVACSVFYPGGPVNAEYREGPFVGYRYADSSGAAVTFPFGHGLSYTRFAYGPAHLTQDDAAVKVTLTLSNIGGRDGAEVVQLYVSKPHTAALRPAQELKAFQKIMLRTGEEQQVILRVPLDDLKVWQPGRGWVLEAGEYELRVGSSSRDVRASLRVQLAGETLSPLPEAVAREYRQPSYPFFVSDEAWHALYGAPLPENREAHPGEFTLDTPLSVLRQVPLGWLLAGTLNVATRPRRPQAEALAEHLIVRDMPLRMLTLGSGGKVSGAALRRLLALLNGGKRLN